MNTENLSLVGMWNDVVKYKNIGRVALGITPRAPTDPDVQNSCIRLFKLRVSLSDEKCYVPLVAAVRDNAPAGIENLPMTGNLVESDDLATCARLAAPQNESVRAS